MRIVVFSEIKWSYLATRKQQLLRRFPKEWEILFLEPYKSGLPNYFRPHRVLPNVVVTTVPFLKNLPTGRLANLFRHPLARRLFFWITNWWIRAVLAKANYSRADIFFVSNLYAVPYLSPRWKIVYDMNDNHLAFENTPPWLEAHLRKLCAMARVIVISCSALKELCANEQNKIRYIGNGVDTAIFAGDENAEPNAKTVLYVGAISEIVDFGLLERLLQQMPSEYRLTMVGPVFPSMQSHLNRLIENYDSKFNWVPAQPQAALGKFIARAHVCLIPFVASELTKFANPNKAYEYLLHGKPVVATTASSTLNEMGDYVFLAGDPDEFIRLALSDFENEKPELRQARQKFARDNSWDMKAQEYIRLLESICKV